MSTFGQPSRKRRRVDTDASKPPKYLQRDQKYYIESGDTIITAGNTLFKIHRYFLSTEGSVMGDLLEIPQSGENALEGKTDACPVAFEGHSADDMRALLWTFYAKPHEINIAIMNPNYPFFLRVAEMCEKWGFSDTLKWACSIIFAAGIPTYQFHEAEILRLARLATVLEDKSIQDLINSFLTRQILDGKMDARPEVIKFSLGYHDPSVSGAAWYRLMLLHRNNKFPSSIPLTAELESRLLRGFASLVQEWQDIQASIQTRHHGECSLDCKIGKQCFHFAHCDIQMATQSAAFLRLNAGDVLGRYLHIVDSLQTPEPFYDSLHGAQLLARVCVARLLFKRREVAAQNLWKHFRSPGTDKPAPETKFQASVSRFAATLFKHLAQERQRAG